MKFKNILSLIAIAAVTLPGFTSCLGDNKDDDPNSQHSISSLYIEQSKNMVVAAPVSGSGEVQTLPGCRILLRVDNNDRTLAMSVADFQYDAQSRAEAFDYPAIPVTVNNNGFTANNATSVSCRGLYSTLEISNFHAEFKTRENGMQNLVALNFVVNNKNRISIEFVNNEYKGVTSSSQLQQSSSVTFSTREPNYLITFDRASKTLSITIDKLLEYARAADAAAEKYDIDVLFICPALEVRRVAENTKHLFVLATYMDTLRPGRGCADILPEGLKAAGAVGVMINHCEKPMSLPQMKKTIDRARELDFLVFACADTLDEAKAIAQLHPDIINPEPSEIIGGGKGASPMAYVRDSIKVIKEIDPNIMVEQAAGITCGQEVYDFIMAGSEAAGAASGIMNAADPIAMIDEMIAATRRAADDLKKQEG